jgi:branched-chain amino acid transport system ATP-binding protein
MDILRVENLSKNFGGLQAVKDVSFTVAKGKCLAIVGPNGSGKTTLFNLIAGSLSPSGGKVYLLGRDVSRMQEHERVHLGLARTFQVMNLFFNLNVLDNFILALEGVSPSRHSMFHLLSSYKNFFDDAEKIMDQWGLWEIRHRLVRELSYGEQRRIEIAVGLASKPKIALLDEPSSGLSDEETTSLNSELLNLMPEMTLIIIEHDMDVVFRIADRIVVLNYGEIIAEGTKQEIKANQRVRDCYFGMVTEGRGKC